MSLNLENLSYNVLQFLNFWTFIFTTRISLYSLLLCITFRCNQLSGGWCNPNGHSEWAGYTMAYWQYCYWSYFMFFLSHIGLPIHDGDSNCIPWHIISKQVCLLRQWGCHLLKINCLCAWAVCYRFDSMKFEMQFPFQLPFQYFLVTTFFSPISTCKFC